MRGSTSGVRYEGKGERVLIGVTTFFLILFAALCFFPFVHVLAVSFATPAEAITRRFLLLPTTFTLENYQQVLGHPVVLRGLMNSMLITAGGVCTGLILLTVTAHPLSSPDLRWRSTLMFLVVFTTLFRAGIIPDFLVIRSLGLINSYFAVILPLSMNAFLLIITVNFFKSVPYSLRESAYIDGASEIQVLTRIMIPMSKPILAALTLFLAVQYWNNFMRPLLYLRDHEMWPIQIMLRQIVVRAQGLALDLEADQVPPPAKSVNMTVIMVATIPVVLVYPFLQKYFVKGIMIGSVKG